MSKLKRISGSRAALALGTWAVYVLAFIPLYRLVGPAVTALGILPVIAMGWLFGMWAGLLASLLVFPLSMLLMALAGGAAWDTMSRGGGLLGSLLLVLIGVVVGRLSDLGERAKRELTERKRAEEQAKQLQEYLQLQSERMPIGSITWDTEFRVRHWNPAAEKIFGFTAQEALGKHPYDLIVPKEAQPLVDGIWRRLLEGDTTAHSINDNITKGGHTIICQWANTPLRKADGTVMGVLSMVQDITERQRAEVELERRVNELSALNAMATIVNESLDVDEILNRAMDEALRLVGVEAVAMLLLDEEAGELEIVAHRGISDEFVQAFSRMKLGQGLAGQAAQTGQPAIMAHLDEYPGALKAYIEKERVQSAASVPLIGAIGVIGVMNLAAPSPRYFDAAGLELLVGLGQQIATGVDKARLYEREREAIAMAAAAQTATDTISAMGDGIILHTLDGRITFLNPAFEKMLGYEKSELLGRHAAELVQEVVTPADLEKTVEAIGTALEGRVPIPSSLTLVSKDGREVPVTFTVSFIRNEKGQPSTVVVAFKDITELKRSQQALRESEQWLSTTLMSIGDAVIATDAQGLVTLMNLVAEDLTGWDEAAALGRPLEDVLHIINERTGERAENPVARVLREGVVVGLANHTVLIATDGTKRPIADSGAPMRDEEGSIIGTVMVFRDITERKRAEEELRYRANLLRDVSDAVISTDMDFKILSWNKAAETIYGWPADEVIGKAMGEAVPTEYPHDQGQEVRKLFLEKEHWRGEVIQKRQDGTPIHILASVSLLKDSAGNPAGAVAVNRDITERKEMQERLLRSEKLAVLGQLAGGVGHELRNPLGAIKNAAYFLHMVLEKPEPDVAETLQILDREVDNCERIISSLLDFAQPRELALRQVHLPEVIEEALARTTVPNLPAQAGNVEVLTRYAEALPLITADPDQLGLVFGNLILNAVQAMPGGGRLTITAAYVEGGTVRNPQSAIRIQVSDTGVGIPEEHLGKIFEPLFTTKAKGIGLGLAVSKTLVERHGGSMEVTSEVGKGSTFTVRLPLAGERGS